MNLIYGILWGLLGQIGSFMQLQGSIKYGWYEKYFWMVLIASIPLSYFYMRSVQYFVTSFSGEIWPSRLIGFGLGIITFSIMSWFMFKEPLTTKTLISIILGFIIVGIQIFWK